MITKTFYGFILITILISGCGSTKEHHPRQSSPEAPEYHYHNGIKDLKSGKIDEAELSFKKAKNLNNNFAPAYEGLGLVQLERNNLDRAEQFINIALIKNINWLPARIAKGRLFIAKGDYKNALSELENILHLKKEKIPVNMIKDIYYWLGVVQQKLGNYTKALSAFQEVLKIDNKDSLTKSAFETTREYITLISGKPVEIKEIAPKDEITRADVAVLFVIGLSAEKKLKDIQSKKDMPIKTHKDSLPEKNVSNFEIRAIDISEDYRLKPFIDKALNLGIMELLPDDTFRPDHKINRAEMALIIEHFLARVFNDPELETKYFKAEASPYSDVLPTFPIFNAVMVVTSSRIMTGFPDGKFRPRKTVSGFEALKIINEIEALF